MKKRINRRFILIALLSIVITTTVMTIVFYVQNRQQIYSDLRALADVLDETSFDGKNSDDIRLSIIEPDGKVSFDSQLDVNGLENHLDRPEIQKAFAEGEGVIVRQSNSMAESIYYYARLRDDGTVLRVGKTTRSVNAIMLSALIIAALLAVILAGISVIFSHYLTLDILSPINRLAENIDIAENDVEYPELIPFTCKIRSQHEEILASANMRQEFTANVSHELKTPLTAISGYAELMESGMASGDDTAHFAAEIRKSAARLLDLINDIIKLSELDEGFSVELTEGADISEIAEETVKTLSLEAQKKNVRMHFQGSPAKIHCSKELAQELTYNLIQNAIRYNKPGGSVYVTVSNIDGAVKFSVEDTGIGIPDEHKERIFERFYRVDKSRSKALGGTGLGLAIVKHICNLTGGTISLSSKAGIGTFIEIIWEM